jgi:hypothetical protein
VAGIVQVDAQYGPSLRLELFNSDGKRVATANRSQYFDFRQLVADSYTLLVHSDISDRTHLHDTVKVPLSLKLPLQSSAALHVVHQRRLFLTVPFALAERSLGEETQLDSSPAFGALVFLLLLAAGVFRSALGEFITALRSGKKTVAKQTVSQPQDKAASFLQGTSLGTSGKKKTRK